MAWLVPCYLSQDVETGDQRARDMALPSLRVGHFELFEHRWVNPNMVPVNVMLCNKDDKLERK